MGHRILVAFTLLAVLTLPIAAQETPKSVVAAYDALADTILSVRLAELTFVASLLDGHYHGAEMLMERGDFKGAAAQMALFANEGDNAIGGVRKKLLEGGHHFNAEGEEKGIFEPGFVIVTREAKKQILADQETVRQATDEAARQAAWESFSAVAKELLKKK